MTNASRCRALRQRARDAARLPIRAEVPADLRAWIDAQAAPGEPRAAVVERLLRERRRAGP